MGCIGVWHPSIGDRDIVSRLTVVTYNGSQAARSIREGPASRASRSRMARPNGIVKRPALGPFQHHHMNVNSGREDLHEQGIKVQQVPHDRRHREQGKDTSRMSGTVERSRVEGVLPTYISQYRWSSSALIGSNMADPSMAPQETMLASLDAQWHRAWRRLTPQPRASTARHMAAALSFQMCYQSIVRRRFKK